MLHSLIIPNRDYTPWLRHCLWSIERSAEICFRGPKEYEVVLVDERSENAPPVPNCGRVVTVPGREEIFNKPRLLNIGLEEARGQVLTFLDADAIVGPRFMEAVDSLERLGALALTKLCYRVRYLPQKALGQLDQKARSFGEDPGARPWAQLEMSWFDRFETYQMASEGYGEADNLLNEKDLKRTDVSAMPVFGNSQFSITRRALGGLEFDEGFIGRGFEDLWMNRQIGRRHGDDYRAAMVTDAAHAMFHVRNPPKENWGPGEQNKANFRRYYAT